MGENKIAQVDRTGFSPQSQPESSTRCEHSSWRGHLGSIVQLLEPSQLVTVPSCGWLKAR